MFLFQTILEFAVAGFIIWGLFNEKKLIKFEDRIAARVKRKFAAKKQNIYHHSSQTVDVSNERCA